jgi:hypothetical protein
MIENETTNKPNLNETLFLDDETKKWKKIEMNKLNVHIGFLFASKPLVALVVAPFIGPLTRKLVHNEKIIL